MQGSSKESKGKRMAMKFMNKLGSKEKFVKNVPGLGRLTHSQDAEVRSPEICVSALISINKTTDINLSTSCRRN